MGDTYWIIFEEIDIKTGRPLEYDARFWATRIMIGCG